MIKKITLMAAVAAASVSFAKAQDTLKISGSADTYYKYDFAKTANIPTYFDSDQNSLSLGMLDLALKKTTGKSSFVGELSFGPRGQLQSLPNGDASGSFHIQNLYTSYAFSDKFSMTAGYMGTFVGYEVISPVGNFNYSTSYLFGAGPFENAGIKANLTLSDKVGVMVGLFNSDWNAYQADPAFGLSNFGAQLSLTPVKGWTAYLNVITGAKSGTEFDLTTAYQITEKFKLGLNAADYSLPGNVDGGFSGVALYPQIAVNSSFTLGARGEYFKNKDVGAVKGTSVTAITFSGNAKAGGLTFIPEIRFDNGSDLIFHDSDGKTTKKAAQISLALVYAF